MGWQQNTTSAAGILRCCAHENEATKRTDNVSMQGSSRGLKKIAEQCCTNKTIESLATGVRSVFLAER